MCSPEVPSGVLAKKSRRPPAGIETPAGMLQPLMRSGESDKTMPERSRVLALSFQISM